MCSRGLCYYNWDWYLKVSPPLLQWHSSVLHYRNVIWDLSRCMHTGLPKLLENDSLILKEIGFAQNILGISPRFYYSTFFLYEMTCYTAPFPNVSPLFFLFFHVQKCDFNIKMCVWGWKTGLWVKLTRNIRKCAILVLSPLCIYFTEVNLEKKQHVYHLVWQLIHQKDRNRDFCLSYSLLTVFLSPV